MKRRGQGEGSIHLRSDGRWVATIDLGWHGSRRIRRSTYHKTRKAAHEALTRALRAVEQGVEPGGRRETTGAYLLDWLEAVSVRPTTARRYRQIVLNQLIPQLGRIPLSKLKPTDVEAMVRELSKSLAPRTVAHVRTVLRTALARAVRHGLVARNAAALAEAPHVEQREAVALTPDQARELLAAVAGDSLEALYVLALASGMRQGELLGLRWSDIDFAAGSLRVQHALQRVDGEYRLVEPKTQRSRRTIPLPPLALAALLRHRAAATSASIASHYVFASASGNPLDGTNITHRLQSHLEAAGLPRVTFHSLRHTAASILLVQGVHPRVAMEILGHATLGMTMNIYSHVTEDLKRDAADRMNQLLGGAT